MDKILIIDDSIMQSQYLKSILHDEYEVQICNNSVESITAAKEFCPTVILLDIVMPEIDGFELLIRLKLQQEIKDTPVILISGMSDVGHEEQGLKMGAVDYIVKPYSKEIVRARVHTHVRIYNLQRSMEALMRVDALTGVFNRKYLNEQCEIQWRYCMKEQQMFTIGMLDIDFFKKYNDQYGHLKGDAVLRAVAQSAQQCLDREHGFVARYGGEEFLFAMQGVSLAQGRAMGEQVGKTVGDLRIAHAASEHGHLTVSIGGISKVPQMGETLEMWLQRADIMLYQAKNHGRNCVVWTDALE